MMYNGLHILGAKVTKGRKLSCLSPGVLVELRRKIIRMDMKLANEDVSMLSFTSEQIIAPFLLPEMVERVASLLNLLLRRIIKGITMLVKAKKVEANTIRIC